MGLTIVIVCLVMSVLWMQNGVMGATVISTDTPYADVGSEVRISCTGGSAIDPALNEFQWRRSPVGVTNVQSAEKIVDTDLVNTYATWSVGISVERFDVTKNGDEFILTIRNFTESDALKYWCRFFRVPETSPDDIASINIEIRLPPSTIALDFDGMTYNDGDSISVVAGDGRQFTCYTPGVYPQTTFTWTLPSSITTDQPLGTTTSSTNTDDTVDSSNVITVSIAENPATSQLTCGATNRQDGSTQPDISITVTLQIKVPPSTITIEYNGVTYNDGGSISVVAGDGRQFTCNTPGVYPQTTFTWTLPSSITTDQPLGTTTSSTNTDGTVDSSNVITVSIAENPATSQLTCGATNRQDGSTQPDISITVTLQMTKVPPSTIALDYDGMTYYDGGSISVVAGDGRQFTCNTPGVYPQTTFTWTLPSSITTDQPLGTTTSSTNTDGTLDSSNVITVSIAENPATSQLTCGATNRQDVSTQPDISITVTLQMTKVTTSNGACSTGVIIGVVLPLLLGIFLLGFLTGRKYSSRRKDSPRADMSQILTEKPIEIQSRRARTINYDQEITSEVMLDVTTGQSSASYGNISVAHKAFPRDQLKVIRELGHGAFGLVLLADAVGIVEKSKVTAVAVKPVKESSPEASKTDFMRELELMRTLPDHPNVVKLLGFCIEKDPLYIIVEFLSKGNLKDLLRDSRSKGGRVYGNLHGASKSLSSKDLMKFAKDAADGMAFISSQKCIHRDLAARNVLVSENLTCKVSDFGLARDVMDVRVYERGKDEKVPLRWMALESFFDNVYTTMSDVWSYGVLLWEIVTLGSRPYPDMTAKTMISKLKMGYRMPKPQHCQEELYEIMMKTWNDEPEDRPTFEMLSKDLEALINARKDYIRVKDFEEAMYESVRPQDENEKV